MDLEGEGDRRTQERQRQECHYCDEPATKHVTYLLDNARCNPASSAYGRDNCSWCSDDSRCVCDKHVQEAEHDPPGGMSWCSTFGGERFAHMLLKWVPLAEDPFEQEVKRLERVVLEFEDEQEEMVADKQLGSAYKKRIKELEAELELEQVKKSTACVTQMMNAIRDAIVGRPDATVEDMRWSEMAPAVERLKGIATAATQLIGAFDRNDGWLDETEALSDMLERK